MSDQNKRGSAAEVFLVFLRLGLSSFGGPIAHIGYFRDEFTTRRKWLSETEFADLVALCQFLPGPASSQFGFAVGLMRAGPLGALAAFIAFTLPSALVLMAVAVAVLQLESAWVGQALHGLKIVAVAIVAQAVWGMAHSLCPDKERGTIALLAVALVAFAPVPIAMPAAIVLGAVIGLFLARGTVYTAQPMPVRISRVFSLLCLTLALALLMGLPLLGPLGGSFASGVALFDSFYRAGALVFGGGHVVLPLLEAELVPAWLSADSFLAGYGAAQAVPGPLFTFAAYLGMAIGGWPAALLALIAIFLPGFLLLLAVLPHWANLRRHSWAQSAMQGANAAVVGILGAALYDPVFTSGVSGLADLVLALLCLLLLMQWKAPPWSVVLLGALGGVLLAL
ncbi:chromate efflux transporter [Thalassobius sp. S69A]|uniref:chromate efflux transporter n=1 Tax=unclassified Thalassovita TaxID=2619711 RepID=UPI003C7D3FE0